MHEFLKSPDDVLALKMSGTITGEDLDAVLDRTEAMMEKHDKVHVYLETHGIGGMQLSALPHHIKRSLPLLGKLSRFGRVAVVSDQGWMRFGTRLESAMFPGISYCVFKPEDRDQALAFVLGKEVVPA